MVCATSSCRGSVLGSLKKSNEISCSAHYYREKTPLKGKHRSNGSPAFCSMESGEVSQAGGIGAVTQRSQAKAVEKIGVSTCDTFC